MARPHYRPVLWGGRGYTPLGCARAPHQQVRACALHAGRTWCQCPTRRDGASAPACRLPVPYPRPRHTPRPHPYPCLPPCPQGYVTPARRRSDQSRVVDYSRPPGSSRSCWPDREGHPTSRVSLGKEPPLTETGETDPCASIAQAIADARLTISRDRFDLSQHQLTSEQKVSAEKEIKDLERKLPRLKQQLLDCRQHPHTEALQTVPSETGWEG